MQKNLKNIQKFEIIQKLGKQLKMWEGKLEIIWRFGKDFEIQRYVGNFWGKIQKFGGKIQKFGGKIRNLEKKLEIWGKSLEICKKKKMEAWRKFGNFCKI